MGGIGWGLVLEGGSIGEIMQPTAALIVFGGTFGATLIAQPLGEAFGALKSLAAVVIGRKDDLARTIDMLLELSFEARRAGIISVEKRVNEIKDPFTRRTLSLAVDRVDVRDIREIMESQIEHTLERREAEARVFETAGGFAPTIGIIGAVLGLIQTMKHLDNIDEVGHGIAVAFVATIYGVGVANILLLPAAKKIVARAEAEARRQRMTLEGAITLAQGVNPRLIRARLEVFLRAPSKAPKETAAAAAEGAPRPAEV